MSVYTHIEIEALDKYIHELYTMHELLKDHFEETKKQLDRIEESWKDTAFVRFKERFDEVYPDINKIATWVEATADIMNAKWLPIIEEYLNS